MIPRYVPAIGHIEVPAFARAGAEDRPLSFILDSGNLRDSDARRALLAYLTAGTIHAYTTTEMSGAPTIELPRIAIDRPPRSGLDDFEAVTWRDADGSNGFMSLGGVTWILRGADERAQTAGACPVEARRVAMLAQAADQTSNCDGFVTDAPLAKQLVDARSTVLTSDEAVALVGLRARLRRDFSLGPDEGPFGRFYFYWVLTRELTPASWPWFSGCFKSSRAPDGDPAVFDLAGAGLSRLDRALRARDLFHGEAKQPHTSTSAEEALFYFETTLLYLSAAFDVLARVAARVYQLPDRPRPSWRYPEWLEVLGEADHDLAAVMAPETRSRDALEGRPAAPQHDPR